jgi:hypothetical protein
VQRDIAESQKPQSPAEPDQVQAKEPAGRRDRQRGQEELQAKDAKLVLDRLDRVSPERACDRTPDQKAKRDQPAKVDHPGRNPARIAVQPVHQ